jgi:sarcosine oxidase
MPFIEADVAVVGVGAMGSMSLWQLGRRGVRAVGFEQFEPGHDRGSSHGGSRIYRTAYLEGPGYVPLAQRAVVLWRELQAASGESLLIESGALMLGPRTSSVITGTMRSVDAYGLVHHVLDAEALAGLYPAHRVGDDEIAIHEDDAGIVRPERAVIAASTLAARAGVTIYRNTAVQRIEIRGNDVQITAGDIICRAGHVVVSAGSWLGRVLPELRVPLRVTRQVPGWFPVERPELFTPDRFPVFLRDIGDHTRPGDIIASDSTFYGFPSIDGRTIKVAVHREGPIVDPDALDRTVTPEDIAAVQEYITVFLRGVNTEPVHAEVCMYTNTADHDFLVGSPPDMPHLTVLGGYSGHGFKFASVMGEIAADLATRGTTQHPIGFLSLDRFAAASA